MGMKALYKVTVLATAVALTLGSMAVRADASAFKSDEDRAAYALGASFAQNMEDFYENQKDLGLKLSKDQLVAGVQDAMANKSKLTNDEIAETLKTFEQQLQEKAAARAEKVAKESLEKGAKYREDYAKKAGVVKTASGLLYKIDKPGSGEAVKSSDVVVVNYRGTLTDGTEFDSSYSRNTPITFPLNSVIAGWTEGLQLIKKGGKMTLVIPPELGYGDRTMGGIPANSTLIFDVELVDVNPEAKPETK
jgi:FKBP-type peptidyl-prolyl cis-trans isomerase FkpA